MYLVAALAWVLLLRNEMYACTFTSGCSKEDPPKNKKNYWNWHIRKAQARNAKKINVESETLIRLEFLCYWMQTCWMSGDNLLSLLVKTTSGLKENANNQGNSAQGLERNGNHIAVKASSTVYDRISNTDEKDKNMEMNSARKLRWGVEMKLFKTQINSTVEIIINRFDNQK